MPGLMLTGYTTPEKIGETAEGIALYADQPAAATAWINFAYQGKLAACRRAGIHSVRILP